MPYNRPCAFDLSTVFGQRQVGYVFTTPFGQVFGGVKSAVMVVGNKFDGLQVIAYAVERTLRGYCYWRTRNMAGVGGLARYRHQYAVNPSVKQMLYHGGLFIMVIMCQVYQHVVAILLALISSIPSIAKRKSCSVSRGDHRR